MQNLVTEDVIQLYADINFPGKRSDENIILFLRRHWLVLVVKLIPMVVYLIILVAFNYIAPQVFDMAGLNLDANFIALIQSTMWMFFWLILFVIWVDYYLDVWIVSDQRVIDIEQMGMFKRRISELEHSKIQDITSDVQGVIPTLLNFGYVYIQTAGEKERFIFKQIPNPVKVRDVIMQLQQWVLLQEKRKESAIMRGKE